VVRPTLPGCSLMRRGAIHALDECAPPEGKPSGTELGLQGCSGFFISVVSVVQSGPGELGRKATRGTAGPRTLRANRSLRRGARAARARTRRPLPRCGRDSRRVRGTNRKSCGCADLNPSPATPVGRGRWCFPPKIEVINAEGLRAYKVSCVKEVHSESELLVLGDENSAGRSARANCSVAEVVAVRHEHRDLALPNHVVFAVSRDLVHDAKEGGAVDPE